MANSATAIAPPRCWGVGLARTGTTSLCKALTLLGYDPVKHNPEFGELPGLMGGSDHGVVLYYKYLDYKFPGSKFVLTLRPLEAWLASMEFILNFYPPLSRDMDVAIGRRMTIYECVGYDERKLTAAYHRHHADVRRYFSKRLGDLLELDIIGGQGWETLCPFLGRPEPDAAFPSLNQRDAMAERRRLGRLRQAGRPEPGPDRID